MRTDLFDFDLPEGLIALRPVHPRDAARLLVVRPGETDTVADKVMADLPLLLEPGDALVFNDTRHIDRCRISQQIDVLPVCVCVCL